MSFVLNVEEGKQPTPLRAQTRVYTIAWTMFNAAHVYTLLFRGSDVHAARLLYTAAAPFAFTLVPPTFLFSLLVALTCASVALL